MTRRTKRGMRSREIRHFPVGWTDAFSRSHRAFASAILRTNSRQSEYCDGRSTASP